MSTIDRTLGSKRAVPRASKTGLLALSPLALLLACAHGPSAQETLPRLRTALDEPVSSAEQNKQNSDLVVQVSEDKHLEGLTRLEVEQKLGKGDPCGRHPICGQRGFYEDDWYYEIGREGSTYLRHRPALILGFNRFGKVERTFVLEVR
ncbi:MAG TPA: hypothetical protein VJU61_11025 [Polyangiaceae bacterium]|nr:hypothetical protein [Polyangiaceae bacterium]